MSEAFHSPARSGRKPSLFTPDTPPSASAPYTPKSGSRSSSRRREKHVSSRFQGNSPSTSQRPPLQTIHPPTVHGLGSPTVALSPNTSFNGIPSSPLNNSYSSPVSARRPSQSEASFLSVNSSLMSPNSSKRVQGLSKRAPAIIKHRIERLIARLRQETLVEEEKGKIYEEVCFQDWKWLWGAGFFWVTNNGERCSTFCIAPLFVSFIFLPVIMFLLCVCRLLLFFFDQRTGCPFPT